jgi:hypothetical protein
MLRFHLKAANGEIIAASQGYETKASAENGIESVRTNPPVPRWWTKPGSCSRFALLGLGQLLRQLIKRGLLLLGNLCCLHMPRLPRK